MWWGGYVHYPNIFFLEVIFQNVFSPKAAGPAAPSFWGKSEDLVGGPRTTWWWSDVPKNPKIMKSKDLAILCDQIRRDRVPESCAPFVRTFLSCQNPINCHVGQFFSFGEANYPHTPPSTHPTPFRFAPIDWAPVSEPVFLDLQIFDYRVFYVCKILLEKHVGEISRNIE